MTLPMTGIPGNLQMHYSTIELVDFLAGEDSFMNMLAIHDHSKTDFAKDQFETSQDDVDNAETEETANPETISEEQSIVNEGGTA